MSFFDGTPNTYIREPKFFPCDPKGGSSKGLSDWGPKIFLTTCSSQLFHLAGGTSFLFLWNRSLKEGTEAVDWMKRRFLTVKVYYFNHVQLYFNCFGKNTLLLSTWIEDEYVRNRWMVTRFCGTFEQQQLSFRELSCVTWMDAST